jgi:hypothetical protein
MQVRFGYSMGQTYQQGLKHSKENLDTMKAQVGALSDPQLAPLLSGIVEEQATIHNLLTANSSHGMPTNPRGEGRLVSPHAPEYMAYRQYI